MDFSLQKKPEEVDVHLVQDYKDFQYHRRSCCLCDLDKPAAAYDFQLSALWSPFREASVRIRFVIAFVASSFAAFSIIEQQITYMAARITVAGLETKLKERGVQTHADWDESMLDIFILDRCIAKLGRPLMAALDPLHWESHFKHLSSRGINFDVAIGGPEVLKMILKITREDDYAKRVSFIIREADVLRRAKHLGVEPFAIRLDDIFLLLRSCYE